MLHEANSAIPTLGADWREELAKHPRVIVYFWAQWSQYDVMLKPVLHRVYLRWKNRMTVLSVDIDQEETAALCALHNIITGPQFFLFRNGAVVDKSLGFKNEAALDALFSDWMHS